jgi:cytochrome c2
VPHEPARDVPGIRWTLVGAALTAAIVAVGAGVEAAVERRDLEQKAAVLAHGDPRSGRRLALAYGCGGCHEIPRVAGARGRVGPPLSGFATRAYVGGVLENTPTNLVTWLQDPRAVDPKTAMPAVGLDERQARDVAAFLYTLD